jgi:UTP--glucose-1-phosphate uridylyltransferase
MTRSADELVAVAADKMRAAGQSEEAIRSFASALLRVRDGVATLMPSAELEPATDVPSLEQLPAAGPDALADLAVIKLNGGLATTMGLEQPKSLIEARDGCSFLDIIVGQTLALRHHHGVSLPLVLMNSDTTRAATVAALAKYSQLAVEGLPLDFLQSMVPKLDAETLAPVSWPASPALEWCPPGHGDIYGALRASGMLDALRARGFRHAMISNSDNLGAKVDPRIAGHLRDEQIPFLMEVVLGTEAERKGGHLARRRSDGRLVLREVAQTPPQDADSFREYRHWRYYNTNTLWVDLERIAELLEQGGGALELPVIVNRKTVDPRDGSTTPVVQLESAMGAAIGCFAGARLLLVPRTRFVPVKTTDDLLLLRSDVYSLGPDLDVTPVPERDGRLPFVDLDKRVYKLLDEFEARIPYGPPSLRASRRLVVRGDVTFGAGVVVRGDVELDAPEPIRIEPGTVLGSGSG